MSTENKSPKGDYMLLFRGNDWSNGLSPEEMQNVVGQWMIWFQGLMAQGKAVAGSPLERGGKLISGKNGKNILSDGPFAESKEAIGGYFLLHVDSREEAVAIAQQCPGLAYGSKVEVRQIIQRCAEANEAAFKKELISKNLGRSLPNEKELTTANA